MDTTHVKVPASWLDDSELTEDELREVVTLGLAAFRRQQQARIDRERVEHVLQGTGRVQHLMAPFVADTNGGTVRQEPPALDGQPVSELLIAQRRGDG
jgi:hypothetical protein